MTRKIEKIIVSEIDVVFFFEDSKGDFTAAEFEPNSFTRRHLDRIEYEIQDYNSEVDLFNDN